MIVRTDPSATRGLWWGALATASALLLAPLLVTDVPPILDYPNHLARLVLLNAGPEDAVLGPLFTPNWTIIPNLALDVIGTPLVHLLPVHVAGRCLLAGILMLNLAGVIALHQALFRRRSYWPLASAVMAYSSTFLLGFLNWQVGSGLAMLFVAGWLTWRDRRPVATITVASVASVVLFFCHLMGLAFFLVLIGSAELHAAWQHKRILVRAVELLPVLAGPAILSLQTTLSEAPSATHWMNLHDKLVQVASPFINYILPLDLISTVLIHGGIMLGIAAGWLVLAPRATVAVIVVAAAYMALPFDLKSASFLDTRVSIMLGLLMFAAVDPIGPRWPIWKGVAISCAALFLLRMAVVMDVWTGHRRDLAQLRAVIAYVPPGAAVYMTNVPQDEAPTYWDAGPRSRRLSNTLRTDYHLPALLLIERGAFWPVLFANPAQQPISLRDRYAALARVAHHIPSHDQLVAQPESAWPSLRAFDFVLMLEAGADANLAGFLPQYLLLIARSDFAALFRVQRGPPTDADGAHEEGSRDRADD